MKVENIKTDYERNNFKANYKRINKKANYARYNIIDLIREVMAKKRKIGLAAVIGAVILLMINFYIIPPYYASTAKLYIVNKKESTDSKEVSLGLRTMLSRDYIEFVSNNNILEKVIKELQLDMDSERLKSSITTNIPKDTRLIEIRVVSQDSELSMNIVNKLVTISAEEFTKVTSIAKFNILEYGSPPLGSEKPNVLRIILLGSCYGSLMSILLIIRCNKKNERIITADDAEYWLGLSTLGEIPLEKERSVHASQLKPNTV
jgi:capsular polysaccharide biosynthesis protein